MPTAQAHLQDIVDRLTAAAIAGVEGIHRSRLANLGKHQLPAICCYRPDESGSPLGGGHPKFNVTFNLVVEVRVAEIDTFDATAGGIMEAVKSALFRDTGWTIRWAGPPSYAIRQFREDNAETPFFGETLTLTVEDAGTHDYAPGGDEIAGILVSVDIQDNGGPDGTAEASADIDNPEVP